MPRSNKRTKPPAPVNSRFRVVAVNRSARYDYDILETVEVGLVLLGTEIKSIRAGKANIREAYARRLGNDIWLYSSHIATYESASYNNHEPLRPRKLLLHRKQADRLAHQIESKQLTLVPLRLYIKDHHAKVELALARGRKTWDKRRAIADRDAQRSLQREVRQWG